MLCVNPNPLAAFTPDITSRIWAKLEPVLRGRGRIDVFGLAIEANVPPLSEVDHDWRARAAEAAAVTPPSNQAQRGAPEAVTRSATVWTLASRAETVVYDALVALQQSCSQHRTIAVAPLPGVRLRDAGVRLPL